MRREIVRSSNHFLVRPSLSVSNIPGLMGRRFHVKLSCFFKVGESVDPCLNLGIGAIKFCGEELCIVEYVSIGVVQTRVRGDQVG